MITWGQCADKKLTRREVAAVTEREAIAALNKSSARLFADIIIDAAWIGMVFGTIILIACIFGGNPQ